MTAELPEGHTALALAAALEACPGVPPAMIAAAREGYYHDYLSPLAMPEIQLVTDLRDLARSPKTRAAARGPLRALAQRVINGDFDASREESDAWAASDEGQATFRELMGGPPL